MGIIDRKDGYNIILLNIIITILFTLKVIEFLVDLLIGSIFNERKNKSQNTVSN